MCVVTNIDEIKSMIAERQKMWEQFAKNSGVSGKRAHGKRAAECSAILGEINKLCRRST